MRARVLMTMLVAILTTAAAVYADTIVVNWAGGGDHMLIQDGIDAADTGDTVLIMPGTYSGEGNRGLDFFVTNCVLKSSGGARSVTIDCGGADRGFFLVGFLTSACVIDGFTITNGHAAFGPGGGMYVYNCSPTIRNCIITGNVADDWGGGAYCSTDAGPSFTGCVFSGNHANVGGGASCTIGTTASFENCMFSDNTASWDAGGAYLDGCSPPFTNCDFEGNSVADAYGRGGGLYLVEGASPTLTGCSFDGNTSTWKGGAVSCNGGTVPTFESCTFSGNTAGDYGGAMLFESFSTPNLVDCTLYANSAPWGSGIWCDDNFTLTNSIIAFGMVGEAVYCDGDPPYPSCSDIYGNAGGDWVGCLAGLDLVNDNFSEDPLFCDAPNGDFTLDVASPCTSNNTPSCGLVGAWGIGCDTPVRTESWGAIKARYR